MRAFTKFVTVMAIVGTVTAIHADSTAPAAAAASVTDMQAAVIRLDSQMKNDLAEVLQFKELARKQKDVIKINCVNDRLVQLKAQLNIADATSSLLQVAISKNSDDRQSLFTQYSGTAGAVKQLRSEADSCIGAPDLMKQESGNTVEKPVIVDDPTVNPFGLNAVEYEPPGYASPYN